MCTPIFRPAYAALAALAAALPLLAAAQQTPPPPPQLEKLEEGEAPTITIRKDDGQRSKITEKKEPGGRVTEVKVQSGKSTYYLKPNEQLGNAQPGDAQSNITRPAQWKVLEFDLGTVRETPEPTGAPAEAPPPAKK